MVSYSVKSVQSLAFLKSPYNDIDVFVEDTTCIGMFNVFFRRVLANRVQFRSVIPVGGKRKELTACQADQVVRSRRRLYVIDGDLDYVTGIPAIRLKHLYRLKAYCFENLLAGDPSAILLVAEESSPDKEAFRIEQELDYRNWLESVAEPLVPLFILYAVAYLLSPQSETVGYSVYRMCDSNAAVPEIDRRQVRVRMRQLLEYIFAESSKTIYRETKNQIRSRVQNIRQRERDIVSGKDYIFPLVWQRLRRGFGFRGTQSQLKVRLAGAIPLSSEKALCRRLRWVASRQGIRISPF